MKIVLINPPRLMNLMSYAMKPSPPLGLAFIAGALKDKNHSIKVIDSIAEAPDQYTNFKDDIVLNGLNEYQIADLVDPDTDIIGLSFMFSGNWLHNKKLIEELGKRFPNAIIIAGGEHITASPQFSLETTNHLDICICGEGEETIVELVDALESNSSLENIKGIVYKDSNNEVFTNPRRNRIKGIQDIAWPAWEYFPLKKYKENGIIYGVDRDVYSVPIMATRGCPYSCTFCSSPMMWGTRYYMRTPEDVVNEIEYFNQKFQIENFDFYDLTAIIKRDWILAFCKELFDRKLDISWQIPAGTRSEVIDREVASNLYKSRCINITYAPESGSKETLKKIKKKVSLERMLKSINDSYKEKLNIKLNVIIGFPEETHQQIWLTMLFVLKASWQGAHDMSPAIFSPYPGSKLANQLMEENKIDILSDEYFYNIIYGDTFFKNHYYNNDININILRFYHISLLAIFYISNYIFFPKRIFSTIKNLFTKNYESRAEMAIGELIKRSKVKVIEDNEAVRT